MITAEIIALYCSEIRELIAENLQIYDRLKDNLTDEEQFGLLQVEEDFLVEMSEYLETIQKRRNQ